MLRQIARPILAAAAFACLSGFTIVWDKPASETGEKAVPQTDEARMAAYAQENWQNKVVPVIEEHVVPLAKLRGLVAESADKAGEAYGLRPEGEANPWNFAVSGEGKIVGAKLKSRAAKLEVDTDGDGKGDVTIQLGPVIRGTALRDAMPFINFTDFRDQIEFAKLANALNDVAHGRLSLPESDPTGETAHFEGVFTLRGDAASIELVPTKLTIGG
ncbi:DUF2291 family protein [Jiella sonneratiae]|uniref:DUF2291 domain-containing protein n=1 Tax=Jiella sonneratiae TaxID=2816856 RepID=A0ABS3J309_9HYPH|nr:DUF2291 domain-containing protein [Jiella sonneratiae]MBO0903520.1 DUF2291 domain-containing protein [Jiella sonneratiae]